MHGLFLSRPGMKWWWEWWGPLRGGLWRVGGISTTGTKTGERERIFQNSIWTKGALIGLVYKNCSSIECRGLLVIYVFICNTCISFRFFMDLTSNFCITSLSGCLTSSNSFLCTVLFECCNFCYRSFGPILNLLKAFDTPAAQYWAVWALCNLTRVYRKCKLFFLEEMEVLKTAWWLRGLVSWKIFSTYFL